MKYAVTVKQTEAYTIIVEVEASDEDEAAEKARELVKTPEFAGKWGLNDMQYDIGEIIEVDEAE